MTILEKIKFEEDWLSEVNLTKENIKIALAGIRATVIEQQPCDDCISREEAISVIQDKYYDNAIGIDIVDMIARMPAAIPEQLGEHFAEGYKKGIENE